MRDLDEHLSAIRAGDDAAFGRWLAGAEPTLRLSLRSFAAHVDVEAVLQEALLRTWQIAPRVAADDGKPNALFRVSLRIARNLAVSERRRLRPELVSDVAAFEEATFSPEPDPLLRQLILDCKGKLPEKPALALAARLEAAGGEPDETLAERLQMRLNTFLQNFTRARKLLGDCLRARGVDIGAEPA